MVTPVTKAGKDLLLLLTHIDASAFQYTSCYCEENIYHLCKSLSEKGLAEKDASDLFVIFISNAVQQVPFWQQKNSPSADGFCVWDYHVICVQKDSKSEKCLVWDLDTTLSFPVELSKYVSGSLRPEVSLNHESRRLFRVIGAPLFLRFFASDRRHMNRGGVWLASPPPYNCIVAEDGEVHNLTEYYTILDEQVLHSRETAIIDGLQGEKFGIVLSQDDFFKLFVG